MKVTDIISFFLLPLIASKVDGIAVDYISRVLYYVDSGNDIIGVMDLNLTFAITLIVLDLDKPRGITIDPIGG